MCGLVFLTGADSFKSIPISLKRINHRGPDHENYWFGGDVSLGFTRLAINGNNESGRQPFQMGKWVSAFNGEVYNHRSIALQFGLTPSECDTHIILPLFLRLGSRVIDEIDGFYAGIFFNSDTRELICLRDHMGKKPLFLGSSRGSLFIASELKAIDSIDWFDPLPLGCSRVCLQTGAVTLLSSHMKEANKDELEGLLNESVRKRMPAPDQPLGIFLSGGLDSSLIASIASQLREDVSYFTLGIDQGPDRQAVSSVVKSLKLKNVHYVSLPSKSEIPQLISDVVYATESYNPSIISNGLATYLLAKAAHEKQIKVVLTGEGADELFGGYHHFKEKDPWQDTRQHLIADMQFTELRRLDLASMAQSIEARCPFLDKKVRSFSDQLNFNQLYSSEENKVILRYRFKEYLPPEIIHRKKVSCDVGSNIRGMVVNYLRHQGKSEREALRTIWESHFNHDAEHPYFHSYPVFDEVIDRRGEMHR